MKATSIGTVRAELAAAQAERAALEALPRSRDDVRAAIVECVEGLAAEARARAERALRRVAAGESPRVATLAVFGAGASGVDAVGLAGVFGADTVLAALLAPLDTVVPEGLDADARARRLAELADEIERSEHLDERLVVESERAGMPVARRADSNIAVVLASATPALPAAAPKRAPVPAEVEADVVEHMTKRARAGLRPAPARSPYLQRSQD